MNENLGWSRIIFPEHRRLMPEITHESKRQTRPVLSEDKLDELNQKIADAIKNDLLITITAFHPFEKKSFKLIPRYVDVHTHRLISDDLEGDRVILKLIDILDVSFSNKIY